MSKPAPDPALIPRESLPVVPRGARPAARREPVYHPEAGRQLPIFGAESSETNPFDLAGLLLGPGRLERMGRTARVSVPVDAAWRVHVLVAELVARGLVVTWRALRTADVRVHDALESTVADAPGGQSRPPTRSELDHESDTPASLPIGTGNPRQPDLSPTDGEITYEVRTAYSSRLNALADAWPAATDQLFLTGPRLRLWVAAAGRPDEDGYALDLDPDVPRIAVDSAMRRAGLDGVMSDHGPQYLISGRKPLHRLAELVGERPAAAPAGVWPGGASA